MNTPPHFTHRPKRGFTLIELLVVVAIIALLISILLPSLSKARSQARTTLCGSRIGQLTKAMLLYANDFDETPPFVGIGHTDLFKTDNYNGQFGGLNEVELMALETWLIKPLTPDIAVADWAAMGDGAPRVETGDLFAYTRFVDMYRCPEFQRTPAGTPSPRTGDPKKQNAFNYTRSVLGRKFLSNMGPLQGTPFPDPEAGDWAWPGPILRLSQVYAPAAMYFLFDEQWDFHCAANYNYSGHRNDGAAFELAGMWMGADPIHGIIWDMIGSYHGTKGRAIPYPEILENQKGGISYYDGHVDFYQDPLPWRTVSPPTALNAVKQRAADDILNNGPGAKILDPFFSSLYAQRAIALPSDLVALLVQLLLS